MGSSAIIEPRRTYETAAVLFLDIVSFSLQTIDQQTELLTLLQELVRQTSEFQRSRAQDELILLPTGDGMALAFMRDLVSPVKCALEIAALLRVHSEIKLRMGVHIGPVCRHAYIKEEINVVGGGINMAQRVMDCGDAGHILLSHHAAEILLQLDDWRDCLQDPGKHKVKHDVEIHLFSLCKNDLGNPDPPQKIRTTQGLLPAQEQGDLIQERALDVAIAREVRILEPTELVALIRQLTSEGLKGVLEGDPDLGVSPNDVRSKPLTLEFPLNERGGVSPAEVLLRIDSPDAVPASQSKLIHVSPTGDTRPFYILAYAYPTRRVAYQR